MQTESQFPKDATVTVLPFTSQPQGEEVVLGRQNGKVFIAIPREALAVLNHLAAGKTIGETEDLYFREHGELPDLDDFLEYLESRGFIGQENGQLSSAVEGPEDATSYHFTNISSTVARRIFGRHSLAACAALVALATTAVFLDPGLVPGPKALLFERNITFYAVVLLVWGYSTIFLHEMGHLLAGRALGVNSRLGIGHRLWVLVAETDLTGLWSVPQRDRYLPLLAGPLIDLASGSIGVLVIFANRQGWIALNPIGLRLAQAMLFVYMMRLLWQFFFFVRTDFYYVITTYLGCKNLLADTEVFLRNQFARIAPWVSPTDQSNIPRSELGIIKVYSFVWIIGRALAFGALFFVTIPLASGYFRLLAGAFQKGFKANPSAFVDAVVIATFTLVPLVAGAVLWIIGLLKNWRRLAS
jgi:putative peptide zinc metalloprotease protein